jgi:hypothetical protein
MPISELTANSFADHQGGLPDLNAAGSSTITTVSTTTVAPNPAAASPVAKAGDLVAVAVASTSVNASSNLMGTVGSGALVYGQTGNPAGGANLSSIATPANIANPAPNTVFLDPDTLVSNPQTVATEQLPATIEYTTKTPDAADVPAPAEATDKGGADVELLPADQGAPTTFTNWTVIDGATGSGERLGEAGLLTIGDSIWTTSPPGDSSTVGNVGDAMIVSSMLAPALFNLAFAGAVSNHKTMSWTSPRRPVSPRWKGARRSPR